MASKNAYVRLIDFAIEELGAGEAIVEKIMEHAELTAEEVLAEADRMSEATFSRVTSHFAAEEQKRAAKIAELQQETQSSVVGLGSSVVGATEAAPKKDSLPAPEPDGGTAGANAGSDESGNAPGQPSQSAEGLAGDSQPSGQ